MCFKDGIADFDTASKEPAPKFQQHLYLVYKSSIPHMIGSVIVVAVAAATGILKLVELSLYNYWFSSMNVEFPYFGAIIMDFVCVVLAFFVCIVAAIMTLKTKSLDINSDLKPLHVAFKWSVASTICAILITIFSFWHFVVLLIHFRLYWFYYALIGLYLGMLLGCIVIIDGSVQCCVKARAAWRELGTNELTVELQPAEVVFPPADLTFPHPVDPRDLNRAYYDLPGRINMAYL